MGVITGALGGALGTKVGGDVGALVVPFVTQFLIKAAGYVGCWPGEHPQGLEAGAPGSITIAKLRRKLKTAKPPGKPQEITVEGAFFPAVLLYSGWWERERRQPLPKLKWQDDLQAWLFNGFEQWGPSWDFNLDGAGEGDDDHCLFGQIGEGDEADSLLVVVPAAKQRWLRDKLADGARVFDVRATGGLYHLKQLDQNDRLHRRIAEYGKGFDYCLLLSAAVPAHRIEPIRSEPDIYSGYLWQCWAPRQWLDKTSTGELFVNPPPLNKVYFLWEHTNFSKPDAVKYNLDSLRHKKKFLEKRYRDLVLLQKSSELVPGTPELKNNVFYRQIVQDVW